MRERHPLALQLTLGLLAAVLGFVLPWSCEPPGPREGLDEEALEELLSYQEPEAFGDSFWLEQAQSGSNFWERAVGVCSARLERPTPGCMAVFRAEILTRLEEIEP